MLSEQQIQNALHASRVVPVSVANPHGPLGLEHVAQIVAEIQGHDDSREEKRVRTLDAPLDTWLRLKQIAEAVTKTEARPVSVSEVAAAILHRYVATHP